MKKNLDKKRLFEKPDFVIILFTNDDIITGSGDVDEDPFWGGPGWNDPADPDPEP